MKLPNKVIVTMKKYDFWQLNNESTYCVLDVNDVVLVKRINGKLRYKLECSPQWNRIYKGFTELEDTTFYNYREYLKMVDLLQNGIEHVKMFSDLQKRKLYIIDCGGHFLQEFYIDTNMIKCRELDTTNSCLLHSSFHDVEKSFIVDHIKRKNVYDYKQYMTFVKQEREEK